MCISTRAGQNINVVPNFAGVKIMVECAEDVCMAEEIPLNADEWNALVMQGFKALAEGGR